MNVKESPAAKRLRIEAKRNAFVCPTESCLQASEHGGKRLQICLISRVADIEIAGDD